MASSSKNRRNRQARSSAGAFRMLDALEQRALLTAATGWVDVFNAGTISGWAKDPDSPNASIAVRITIDGNATDITANQARADLGGNFGFSFTPNLAPGAHTVVVQAIDAQSNTPTTLRSATLANAAPAGSVDVISATRIAGWARDPDTGNPVTIRIDKNGTTVQTITANRARGDLTGVNANKAFDVTGDFSGIIDVYAIDAPTGSAVLLKSTNRATTGSVEVLTRNQVAGWAFDADRPNAAVTIRVKVDGAVAAEGAANINRPDIAPATGGTTAHGFNFSLSLAPGTHTIQVYAVEADTSSVTETLLAATAGATNPAPTGSIDNASRSAVQGWAYDPDAGASPITVQVKVDGTVVATGTANQNRPDIVGVTGTPNHGYTVALSNLATGPHRIQVDALDVPTGASVKLAERVIDNTAPIGSLDIASPSRIAGWAVDPDAQSSTVQVIFEVDGTRYAAVSADKARGDLGQFTSNAHGFDTTMPTHLFGSHVVRLIAVDTFDGSEKVIAQRSFTNAAPVGGIDVASKAQVAGWTADPDAPTRSIEILVRVDGTIAARLTASNSRPDLPQPYGPLHGYSFALNNLTAGNHTMEIFGVDPATGVTQLLGTRTIVA